MGNGDSKLKKLALPYYPNAKQDSGGHNWIVHTVDEKSVSDYCNMSIREVENLDLVAFLCYRRDARIYNLSQTEDGQTYLKNAWRIMQTAPDRKKLRQKYGTENGELN